MTLKLVARIAVTDLKMLRAKFSAHTLVVGIVVGAMLGWFFFKLTSESFGTLPLMMAVGAMWGLVGAVVWDFFLKDLGLIAPLALLVFGEARPAADFGFSAEDLHEAPAPVEIEMPQARRPATTVAELRQRQQPNPAEMEESALQPEMAAV